jgi:RNA polymerase sigma factor (sigma-70 family)
MPRTLEDLARQAIGGDREALDLLVRALQGDVYGLALRMLWNREDAEDATQEILVRTVTRLAQFDFRSKLKTWVYRIAVNYLLDVKKSPVEQVRLNFQRFGDDLVDGLSSGGPADSERSLLVEEVKIGCTLGMLQCLDRPHRLAYVLGEILDLSGPDSAEALEIPPELFRKRLQHARMAKRLHGRTVASHRTARPARAIDGYQWPFASAASVPTRSISPSDRRHIRRSAHSFAAPSRRDGRCRSIARVTLWRRPSTSHVASSSRSTHRVIRSHPAAPVHTNVSDELQSLAKSLREVVGLTESAFELRQRS